jgi:uncharacterized protein
MNARRIPLFPLNTVLFPGMTLPLHIFEPRYQEMIRRCLGADRTFGVCLIRSGTEVGGPAQPYSIGTTCEIVAVDALDEGRMNLVAVGKDRFRVTRLCTDEAFLEGEVELLPLEEAGDLGELPALVQEATRAYLTGMLGAEEQAEKLGLPDDPAVLSNLVGAVLQVPLAVRQELLETQVIAERLRRQLELLRAESEKLQSGQTARPFRADPDQVSPN